MYPDSLAKEGRMLVQGLIPLTGDVSSRRIFSPLAYRLVREANIVPIVHTEAIRLASWFPLAWHRQDGGVHLVALRSLLPQIGAVPAPVRGSFNHLPVLLQAFPFGLDPSQPIGPDSPKMLCDDVAEFADNVGAPITTPDHKLSRATLQRFAALDFFCEHAPATEAIGRTLLDGGLLEPWQLVFDVEGTKVDIPDMLIVRQSLFAGGGLAFVMARHGAMAAQLIGLHRLSLYRAGMLLAAARAAASKPESEQDFLLSSDQGDWED
jgi:hypothetical protein